MKNEPKFRLATEADAGTLLRFMREYYAFDGHGFDEPKAHVALRALLRDQNLGRAWLILDGGGPVGYVVLCFGYSLELLIYLQRRSILPHDLQMKRSNIRCSCRLFQEFHCLAPPPASSILLQKIEFVDESVPAQPRSGTGTEEEE
jgi:hypothetical protein